MRRIFLFALTLISLWSNGQTTLVTGDIAFTGMNTSTGGNDDFSFIVLRSGGIAAGTKIKFTDRGWQSGACNTPVWGSSVEGEIEWTAISAVPYAAQVRISTTPLGTSTGSVSLVGSALNLIQGDQLFAYQGTQTAPTAMIAGIHLNIEIPLGTTNSSNWDNLASITNGSSSNRPPCLTNGTYAFFFSQSTSDRVNARLKPSVNLTGVRATDLALINNDANWDSNNDVSTAGLYSLPVVFNTPLPVKFTFINVLGDTPKLKWRIVEENNVKDYVIEKSTDGSAFISVNSIRATGAQEYFWVDPINTSAYYRIKANDFDGKFVYSPIVKYSTTKNRESVIAYFNNNSIFITLNSVREGKYFISLISVAGSLLAKTAISHSGSSSSHLVGVDATRQKGTFIILIEGPNFKKAIKLVN